MFPNLFCQLEAYCQIFVHLPARKKNRHNFSDSGNITSLFKLLFMENGTHKGTEFNNVQETWNQNERNLQNESAAGAGSAADETAPKNDLEKLIKQEASEYDDANKEDRILDGERATVTDENTGTSSDL